ncbi:Hyphal wall protein 1 [Labeo rohita]|uniref:Hyphal wall protein 1 n=1 Tax=Labeo rohita TaxID=84645 RepID=A0ABQ8L3T2_LABRO|nr:Hyphal wall protein 1 [Labeo rohita]
MSLSPCHFSQTVAVHPGLLLPSPIAPIASTPVTYQRQYKYLGLPVTHGRVLDCVFVVSQCLVLLPGLSQYSATQGSSNFFHGHHPGMEYTYLTVGSSFTVGVANEERDTPVMPVAQPARGVAGASERAHIMAATVEPARKMAAAPERDATNTPAAWPAHDTAALLEHAQAGVAALERLLEMAANVELIRKMAARTESRHVTAAIPEPYEGAAVFPELSQVSKSSQVGAVFPELIKLQPSFLSHCTRWLPPRFESARKMAAATPESARKMAAATPESARKMAAATPESARKMAAATPESARKMAAATPESARKMAAATPESARKMAAATPESARKMAAATPESARKMAAATPEPVAKMAAMPEPVAKMAATPEPVAKMTAIAPSAQPAPANATSAQPAPANATSAQPAPANATSTQSAPANTASDPKPTPKLTPVPESAPEITPVLKSASEVTPDHKPAPGLPSDHRAAPELSSDHKPAPELPSDHKPAPGLPSDHKPAPGLPSDHKPASEVPSGLKPAPEVPSGPKSAPEVPSVGEAAPMPPEVSAVAVDPPLEVAPPYKLSASPLILSASSVTVLPRLLRLLFRPEGRCASCSAFRSVLEGCCAFTLYSVCLLCPCFPQVPDRDTDSCSARKAAPPLAPPPAPPWWAPPAPPWKVPALPVLSQSPGPPQGPGPPALALSNPRPTAPWTMVCLERLEAALWGGLCYESGRVLWSAHRQMSLSPCHFSQTVAVHPGLLLPSPIAPIASTPVTYQRQYKYLGLPVTHGRVLDCVFVVSQCLVLLPGLSRFSMSLSGIINKSMHMDPLVSRPVPLVTVRVGNHCHVFTKS